MAGKPKKRASAEAREADVFLRGSESLLKWLQKNVIAVFAVLGIGLAGALGASIYGWWQTEKEQKAQEAFFRVEKDYKDTRSNFEKAKATQATALKDKKKKRDKTSTEGLPSGDLEKDYGKVLSRLEVVEKKHAGSSAAHLASLLSARILVEYKEFQRAEKSLLGSAEKKTSSKFLQALVQVMLGTVIEAQGRCEVAVTHWQSVLAMESVGYLHAEALLRQALCFENLSKTSQARDLYQRIQRDHAKSSAGQKAKTYLRLLNIKEGS